MQESIYSIEGGGHGEVEQSSRVVVSRDYRGGLIVLALVAGGIWFFISKPFQMQVKQTYNQATQWTPENIKKDPVDT